METTEQKTAKTVLEEPVSIEIGGRTYRVPQPTTATLILVSANISRMPRIAMDEPSKVMTTTLHVAKDCAPLGDILAILIVGARGLRGSGVLGWWKRRRIKRLAARLLEEATPKELATATYQLLSRTQIADFFGLTAFLSEVNLTKETKAGTTASGQ